ncbi:MAG: SWIM zinc finger family protein [Caldilineaceae bacterium]|jgi:hypothetical protein
MDSVASRIIKGRQYAEERDQRIRARSFEIELHGEHANHLVTYDNGIWTCDCEEFQLRGVCAHIMAMEEILGDSVEPAVLQGPQVA